MYSSLLLAGLTAAADSGDITILSMNVAGLPSILQSNDVPGDKTTNAKTIGTYFAKYGYDVIHVQEVSAQRNELSWSLLDARPDQSKYQFGALWLLTVS